MPPHLSSSPSSRSHDPARLLPHPARGQGGDGGPGRPAREEARPAVELEQRQTDKAERAAKSISGISLDVDKLATKVSALEAIVGKGGKVVDADVVTLTEAHMNELVKLDSTATDGEVKVQLRMQEKRLHKYVETLDAIRAKNAAPHKANSKRERQRPRQGPRARSSTTSRRALFARVAAAELPAALARRCATGTLRRCRPWLEPGDLATGGGAGMGSSVAEVGNAGRSRCGHRAEEAARAADEGRWEQGPMVCAGVHKGEVNERQMEMTYEPSSMSA
ncbi:hypothetical protein BS78_05G108500 [Paspalum vaginatum]|nr:hypothetical protein BS78_05G108500 [Paspalum vaginatum]